MRHLLTEMPRRILILILLFPGWLHATEQDPPWQQAGQWPDRIIATLSSEPASGFNVSWRTGPGIDSTMAEIVPASAKARFDLEAESVPAESQLFKFDPAFAKSKRTSDSNSLMINPVTYHSVGFKGLKADTLYAYRVQGATGNWSSWRQIRTAPLTGPVEFLYFGDSQNGIRSNVSRVFETASMVAPGARFMLHTGDLVNSGNNDRLWAEWFDAGGRLFGRIPSIPVPGNHDYTKLELEGQAPQTVLSPFWQPQFRLPVEESLPEALHEAVYAIPYTPDLHLFAIDSHGPDFELQMKWLDGQFRGSEAKWRVIYMHHPYFSWVGDGLEKEEQTRRRAMFDAFLQQYDVDLVLTGHRHSYQRAESGPGVDGVDKTVPYSVDTVFLVTASTIKRGTTKTDGWKNFSDERDGNFTLTRWGDDVPLFGVVRIDGDELSFSAIDALGLTYDQFTLIKEGDGRKMLQNGTAAFGPVANKTSGDSH